jgi:hypothetical protein
VVSTVETITPSRLADAVLRQKIRSYLLQLSTTAYRMSAAVHCLLLNKMVNKRTADVRFVAPCI